MNTRKFLVLLGIIALLLGGVLGCASAGKVQPIGNATGTATGTGTGFGGDVFVTITMDRGFITDVVIDAKNETQAIAGVAVNRATGLIKQNNSAQFDAISGATFTSVGISQAAQAAIDAIVAGN